MTTTNATTTLYPDAHQLAHALALLRPRRAARGHGHGGRRVVDFPGVPRAAGNHPPRHRRQYPDHHKHADNHGAAWCDRALRHARLHDFTIPPNGSSGRHRRSPAVPLDVVGDLVDAQPRTATHPALRSGAPAHPQQRTKGHHRHARTGKGARRIDRPGDLIPPWIGSTPESTPAPSCLPPHVSYLFSRVAAIIPGFSRCSWNSRHIGRSSMLSRSKARPTHRHPFAPLGEPGCRSHSSPCSSAPCSVPACKPVAGAGQRRLRCRHAHRHRDDQQPGFRFHLLPALHAAHGPKRR